MAGTADKQAKKKKTDYSTGLDIEVFESQLKQRTDTTDKRLDLRSLFTADYYPKQNQNISSCLAGIQQPLPLQHCPLPDNYLI